MSILGVITEYNPFHNGHLYHLQRAKELTQATTTIAVMSGQFVQRGEPALIDKWQRAKIALEHGIDLVIELPTAFAIQSAELFAYGAVSILDQLKVSTLVFGSESNNLDELTTVANLLANESDHFRNQLHYYLNEGQSYPKAVNSTINSILIKGTATAKQDALYKANDILGIQYLRAIKHMESNIKALVVARMHSEYTDMTIRNETIASATAIRNELLTSQQTAIVKSLVPENSLLTLNQAISKNRLNSWENYYRTIQIMLSSYSKEQLSEIAGMDEGLENRLQSQVQHANSFAELIVLSVSKRYTATKIKRTLLNLLLNLTKDLHTQLGLEQGAKYLRVLGFNANGQAYLNSVKNELTVPIITNIPRERPLMLDFDLKANSIYNIGINRIDAATEYKEKPIILE